MSTMRERFLARVERFLAVTGTKPSEFGHLVVGDRAFVTKLRRGRSPTLATADRVIAYIEAAERAGQGSGAARGRL